jgi:AraC family transcriptional regulator
MPELRRLDFPGFTIREIAYPAGARQMRHAHDYGNITAVIRGEMVERSESGEYNGRSCSVVVKPPHTPHANTIPGRVPVLTLSVQFDASSPFTPRLGTWRWLDQAASSRAALAFHRAVRTNTAVEAAAHDFTHAILSFGSADDAPPAWFRELRAQLEQRFAEPLSFGALARQLGLHPVYVARAFRRYAGVSMGDFVRALRLREARHLLGTTRRSASAIALDAGFADASHLCRHFGRALGCSPRTYRSLCQV